MMPNIADRKRTEAADLAATVQEYEKAGGAITALPGFQAKALPARGPDDQQLNLIIKLRAMARKGYSRRYAALCLGIRDSTAAEIARTNRIRFRADPAKPHRI